MRYSTFLEVLGLTSKETAYIQHVAIIQAEQTALNNTAKRISNALLKYAYPKLKKETMHTIGCTELLALAGMQDDVSREALITRVRKLSTTSVRWKIAEDELSSEWTVSCVLASARYNPGTDELEYAYSAHLRELFLHPKIFSQLSLLVQGAKSIYTLRMWEYFNVKLAANEGQRYLEWLTIEDLRKMLKVNPDRYARFKGFHQMVLKPTIEEVNNSTDIKIRINAEKTVGRKITHLQILATRKKNHKA
jgi:hypothetical protein